MAGLTEPELLSQWLLSVSGLELEPGAAFTLTPVASGTRLLIVQSGFETDQKRNFAGARYGWKMMGEKLVGLLGRNAGTGAKSSARRTAGCPSSSQRWWS